MQELILIYFDAITTNCPLICGSVDE